MDKWWGWPWLGVGQLIHRQSEWSQGLRGGTVKILIAFFFLRINYGAFFKGFFFFEDHF